MQRLRERFRRPVTWDTLRADVDHQLRRLPDAVRPSAGLSLADIRTFMARSAGFETWASFLDALRLDGEHSDVDARVAVVPPHSDPGPSGMLQPLELRITLPMELQGGEDTTTTDVWHMLAATHAGDLERVKSLVAATPGLVRCEHNYLAPLQPGGSRRSQRSRPFSSGKRCLRPTARNIPLQREAVHNRRGSRPYRDRTAAA